MISSNKSGNKDNASWFFFLILFLVIDLGRPQDILPLSSLKIGMVVTLILAFFLISSGRFFYLLNRQTKLILLFILLIAVYVPFATNNFYAFTTFKTMFLMLPFLLSTVILIDSQIRLLFICKVYSAVIIMMSIYSLLHNGLGTGGFLQDENDLCMFLVTYFPLLLFVTGQEKKPVYKFIWGMGIFLTVIAISYTSSRGGFVGFCGMISIYWWFSKKKIAVLFGIVILALLMFVFGGDSFRKDIGTITDTKESTANERLLSWEAGWAMFLDNPLGVGGSNFPIHFPEYQSKEFERVMWGRAAHSLWFTLIPETGIFGILIFFLIIRLNLQDIKYLYGFRENDLFSKFAITLYASFAGFFCAATFLSALYYPLFWYSTVLVVSARKIADHSQTVSP